MKNEKPITHLGGFLLQYVDRGQVKEKFTWFVSERQREIIMEGHACTYKGTGA